MYATGRLDTAGFVKGWSVQIASDRRPPPQRRVRNLGLADADATAAIAIGYKGIDWLAGLTGYECAVVTRQGRVFVSPGLRVRG